MVNLFLSSLQYHSGLLRDCSTAVPLPSNCVTFLLVALYHGAYMEGTGRQVGDDYTVGLNVSLCGD